MLLDGVFLRRDCKMLRRAFGPVNPVCKADAGKAQRVVAVQASRWNFHADAVRALIDLRDDLEILGMAEGVHIIAAETGHFSSVKILRLGGEKDKVVAEARNRSLALQIARVDEHLDAISFAKIGVDHFLKRGLDEEEKGELVHIPTGIYIGKRLFAEEIRRSGQEVILIGL